MKRINAKGPENEGEPVQSFRPLIEITDDAYYVLVSHQELDSLIAKLMHLAELDSDKEHRDALKGELKVISRQWLDELYEDSGYRNYRVKHNVESIVI